MRKLDIKQCYLQAWKSFSKWWIPICLISGILFIFQIVPRLLIHTDTNELLNLIRTTGNVTSFDQIIENVNTQTIQLIGKIIRFVLYLFPFIALATIVLLMYANWAVKNKKDTRSSFSRIVYISFIHIILAVVKSLGFLFFLLPGIYLYIKLMFVSLIMLESKKGAWEAIKLSWKMTKGNFKRLLLLIIMNSVIQLIAMPTIIGNIPIAGFTSTVRARAFHTICKELESVS